MLKQWGGLFRSQISVIYLRSVWFSFELGPTNRPSPRADQWSRIRNCEGEELDKDLGGNGMELYKPMLTKIDLGYNCERKDRDMVQWNWNWNGAYMSARNNCEWFWMSQTLRRITIYGMKLGRFLNVHLDVHRTPNCKICRL